MNSVRELTDFYVSSSRIRLARNVEGMPFPSKQERASKEKNFALIAGAKEAASGIFDGELFLMSGLTRLQKAALVERHIISLPLANNDATGAVLIERGNERMSVMLNEEDRIREQCATDGLSLEEAYAKLERYDNNLNKRLPIAFDSQFGYLTSCITNLGTGMRASTMLFLPALKLAGATEFVLREFIAKFGLTVRGVYGEGSEALGDMYQLSNSRTLGIDETSIIELINKATVELCIGERRALEKLKREKGAELLDRVSRSYATLCGAFKLGYYELMRLISDVKLGAALEVMPFQSVRKLDKLVTDCSISSIKLQLKNKSDEEADIYRAAQIKKLLKEDL